MPEHAKTLEKSVKEVLKWARGLDTPTAELSYMLSIGTATIGLMRKEGFNPTMRIYRRIAEKSPRADYHVGLVDDVIKWARSTRSNVSQIARGRDFTREALSSRKNEDWNPRLRTILELAKARDALGE